MKRIALAIAMLAAAALPVRAAAQDVSVPDTPITPVDQCPYANGWNLVTLAGTPANLPDCVTAAFYYDGFLERWHAWGRSGPDWACDLTTFELGKGYWLYVRK